MQLRSGHSREIPSTNMWSLRGKKKRVPWLAVLVLLFVGFFGLSHINGESINVDELLAFGDMGGFASIAYSPAQIIDSLVNNHPDHVPLWYLLGAFAAQFTGWSQAGLRATTVLTSLITLATLFRFTAIYVNRKTALTTLLLMATTEVILHYTYKIRMSQLLMLLGVIHCWSYWRLINDRTSFSSWLAFVSTGTALLYTHAFGVLLLIGMGANHLFFGSKRHNWRKIVAGWIVTGLLFSLYLPVMVAGFNYNFKNQSDANVIDVIALIARDFSNDGLLLFIPMLIALGFALWKTPNSFISAILRIGLVGLTTYLLAKLVLDEMLITRTRYLFVLWFALVIPFAYGISSLPRRLQLMILAIWIAVFFIDIRPDQVPCVSSDSCIYRPSSLELLRQTPGPREIFLSSFDQSDTANRTRVVRAHRYSMVDFYLRELGFHSLAVRSKRSQDYVESVYKGLANDYRRFLLGYDPSKLAPNFFQLIELIETEFVACNIVIEAPPIRVQRFVDRLIGCDHRAEPIVYSSNISVLDRFAQYHSAEKILKVMTWIEPEYLDQERLYNVSWQILTPNLQNIRQVDRHLHDSTVLPWSTIEMSTKGLAPGDYRLVLILYRSDTGKKDYYLDTATGQESGFLPVLDFTVE